VIALDCVHDSACDALLRPTPAFLHPAAEKKFKKLAGANEVLSDPEKRREDDHALIMSRASGSWYPRA
jgi:curved DNA-binding protein CbpA